MSVKKERDRVLEAGGPCAKHSLNQENLRRSVDQENKYFGVSKKDKRSARREYEEWETFEERLEMQFNRALGRVFDGKATPQDLNYIDRFGEVKDKFNTELGSKVIVTIVDFRTIKRDELLAQKSEDNLAA